MGGTERTGGEAGARGRVPGLVERELTRRGLLATGIAGVLSVSAAVRALESLAAEEAAAQTLSLTTPADEVRATIAAFADTIVPGPAGGASPTPGAIEAGAVDEIYDPFYGLAEIYPLVHADIQLAAPRVLGRPARFDLALPYPDRERVVMDRITEAPRGGNPYAVGYQAVAVLVYFAYYGTPRSDAGPRTIGFPPHSDGYFPRHSYKVRFRRMTKHGNPR